MTESRHALLLDYKADGYRELAADQNSSGVQSDILINQKTKIVIKISAAKPYHAFVDFALSSKNDALPVFYENRWVAQDGISVDLGFSVTKMELLKPLSDKDWESLGVWLPHAEEAIKNSTPPCSGDPFDLFDALTSIWSFAKENEFGVDLIDRANFMKRSSVGIERIVILDPVD